MDLLLRSSAALTKEEEAMQKKRSLRALFTLLLLLLLSWAVLPSHQALARNAPEHTIPKSYGALKGAIADDFIFEDSSGTIRLVNPRNAEVEFTYRRE